MPTPFNFIPVRQEITQIPPAVGTTVIHSSMEVYSCSINNNGQFFLLVQSQIRPGIWVPPFQQGVYINFAVPIQSLQIDQSATGPFTFPTPVTGLPLGTQVEVTLIDAPGTASAGTPGTVATGGTKRSSIITNTAVAGGGTTDIVLDTTTTEYTIRVVDATTKAPIAWTLAYVSAPTLQFHFLANEGWVEDKLGPLTASLSLRIGAAVAGTIELVQWTG